MRCIGFDPVVPSVVTRTTELVMVCSHGTSTTMLRTRTGTGVGGLLMVLKQIQGSFLAAKDCN